MLYTESCKGLDVMPQSCARIEHVETTRPANAVIFFPPSHHLLVSVSKWITGRALLQVCGMSPHPGQLPEICLCSSYQLGDDIGWGLSLGWARCRCAARRPAPDSSQVLSLFILSTGTWIWLGIELWLSLLQVCGASPHPGQLPSVLSIQFIHWEIS